MTRRRLDAELVRRRMVDSREQARAAIDQGRVTVSGTTATKAATQVDDASAIDITVGPTDSYVSRGAHKLIGALDAFGFDVHDRDCLDAGASTGGFTDVLLQRGARRVIAIDVGYGQLAWKLRTDDRVTVLERTNIRHLETPLPYQASVVVADVSFISLTLILEPLMRVVSDDAEFLLMVKPQFEVGKESVGSGVVTDPGLRVSAIASVAKVAERLGLRIHGVVASPLPGPKGNVEYFLWMSKPGGDVLPGVEDDGGLAVGGGSVLTGSDLQAAIVRAVEEGPR